MKRVSKPLKVGAVARRLGISAAMIRSWEVLGLTTPARTESRYRLYTEDDLRVLRRATHLRKDKGLNTPAILMQLKQEGLLKQRAASPARHQSVGPVLRRLRLQHGTSLSKVAQSVGVSKGFLSNLERSRCQASSSVLRGLARYYRIAGFSPAEPVSRGPLLTPRERKTLPGIPGVRVELLALGATAIEPHLFHINPGADSGEAYGHKGEEFIYLMRGGLEIEMGGRKFQLREGDSFSFSSTTPHRWRNPGPGKTVALWITTPARF
jgi:DNA-binding transcriptional MerR regulator/quercetin dioxygenase-like cupin family protein